MRPTAATAAAGATPLGGPGYGPRSGNGYGYGRGFRGYGYGYGGWCGVGLGYGYWYGYPYYASVTATRFTSMGFQDRRPTCIRRPVQSARREQRPFLRALSGPVRLTDTDVMLSIHVPPEAIVRINGVPTTQHGPRREFISSDLTPGRTYTFVVTAQWTEPNRQAVELQRTLSVQGGERRYVYFTIPSAPPPNDLPAADRVGR